MKTKAFWISTALLTLVFGGGGVADILMVDAMKEAFTILQYPFYMGTIIGVAKVLGVAVMLLPGLPRLKEWAYAGFVIDLIGAGWSHLAVGDTLANTVPAFAIIPIVLVSWFTRPESRRLAGPTL